MALDPPKPGQVSGHRYLWWSEHRKGQEEGAKDRPCAVVYAVETKGGKTRVYVLPITHTKPLDTEDGRDRDGVPNPTVLKILYGISRVVTPAGDEHL